MGMISALRQPPGDDTQGEELGQIVGECGGHVRLHGCNIEQQKEDRNDDAKHTEGITAKPIKEGVQETDAIDKAKAVATPQRAQWTAKDLHEAQRPAAALGDVFLQSFRCQAERKLLIEIDGAITDLLHLQRNEIVLGDGFGGKATDALQYLEAEHRRCAAAEGCSPRVLRGHHHVKEIALFVRPHVCGREVDLHRVGVGEVLRRLHDANVAVAHEGERAAQKLRGWNEIRVQNTYECGRFGQCRHVPETIVDVSGLGVGVVRPGQVARPQPHRHRREPRPPSIIENPDPKTPVVHGHGTDDGALEDRLLLVVRANKYVNEWRWIVGIKPRQVAIGNGGSIAHTRQAN